MPVVLRRQTGPDAALFPDCLDSMGSRHFPTEQLWLGENPGVFLTEYLRDWQGPGYFLCFLLPGIVITYIMCMYCSELCFVPGNRSASCTSYKEQLHVEKMWAGLNAIYLFLYKLHPSHCLVHIHEYSKNAFA